MKLLTTIVTDSILIPKMAKRERCQTIWYSNAGKPEKKNKTGAATMSGSRRTFGSADSTPWNKAVSRILIYSSPELLSLDRVASKDASPAPNLLAPRPSPRSGRTRTWAPSGRAVGRTASRRSDAFQQDPGRSAPRPRASSSMSRTLNEA